MIGRKYGIIIGRKGKKKKKKKKSTYVEVEEEP